MLRRNGPVVKSVESVPRLEGSLEEEEGSLWWERFDAVGRYLPHAQGRLHHLITNLTVTQPPTDSIVWPKSRILSHRPCLLVDLLLFATGRHNDTPFTIHSTHRLITST